MMLRCTGAALSLQNRQTVLHRSCAAPQATPTRCVASGHLGILPAHVLKGRTPPLAAGWGLSVAVAPLASSPAQAAQCRVAASTTGNSSSRSNSDEPGFGVLRISGDGRCLFRSLAQGNHLAAQADAAAASGRAEQQAPQLLSAEGEVAKADSVRQAICDELLARRDELCFFVDEDYDQYVKRMRKDHTWGGEPELAVACHVLQRPIAVYMQAQQRLSLVSRYGEGLFNGKQEVPLLFHGAGHYDLLVRQSGQPPQPPPRSKL